MNYIFNHNVERMAPSATIALMDKAKAMKAQGINVLALGAGEPDFNTPPEAAYEAIRAICANHTHYTDGHGFLPLRRRLMQKLQEENGIPCTEKSILITPSAKYALYLAICTLINPGDEVMILDPSWVSYSQMVMAVGGIPVNVALSYEDNYTIRPEVLEAAVSPKTRLLILCTPNNPTGRMITPTEAAVITEFATRHDLMIVSDEIYEKLAYDGNKHISLGSIAELADRVVTVNGFSKFAAMTGWRIGYLTANLQVVNQIYMLFNHTISCIPQFSQEAAVVALDCEKELNIMRESFLARRNYFVGELNNLPGVSCHTPQGAFYAWVRIEKDDMSSSELADYLLQKALLVATPGNAFGSGGEKCLRMSFSVAQPVLEEAIKRLHQVL